MAGARSYRFRLVIQTVTEPRELAPQQRLAAEPHVDRPVDQRRIERLAGLDGDDHVSDRTLLVETAGVAVRGHLGAGRGQQMHILDLARSEEHTSELQSLMRISYAGFCLKQK